MLSRDDGGPCRRVLPISGDMVANDQARLARLSLISDVDAAVAAIKADGGAVHMGAAGPARLAGSPWFPDPTGALFYIMQPILPGR